MTSNIFSITLCISLRGMSLVEDERAEDFAVLLSQEEYEMQAREYLALVRDTEAEYGNLSYEMSLVLTRFCSLLRRAGRRDQALPLWNQVLLVDRSVYDSKLVELEEEEKREQNVLESQPARNLVHKKDPLSSSCYKDGAKRKRDCERAKLLVMFEKKRSKAKEEIRTILRLSTEKESLKKLPAAFSGASLADSSRSSEKPKSMSRDDSDLGRRFGGFVERNSGVVDAVASGTGMRFSVKIGGRIKVK